MRGHEPRAAAAKAESGHENPPAIDGVVLQRILHERHGPALAARIAPCLRWTIRGHDDRLEIPQARCDDLAHVRAAVVARTRTAGMQREHQRPRIFRVVVVRDRDAVKHLADAVHLQRVILDATLWRLPEQDEQRDQKAVHHRGPSKSGAASASGAMTSRSRRSSTVRRCRRRSSATVAADVDTTTVSIFGTTMMNWPPKPQAKNVSRPAISRSHQP